MQDSRELFPSVPQAALLLLAHFLLQYVLGILFYDFRGVLDVTTSQMGALVMLLASGIVLVSVMHFRRMTYGDLLHPSASRWLPTLALLVPPLLLTVPLIILVDHGLMELLHGVFPVSAWEEQAFAQMLAPELSSIVATCLLAPVLEEMLFRGVLLRAFLTRYARWAAIAYSALFFGAAHLNIYQFFLAFGLGLILGWLFERSRSLIPCIALHGAVNMSVILLASPTGPSDASVLSQVPVSGWVVAIGAGALGVMVLHKVLRPHSGRSSTH